MPECDMYNPKSNYFCNFCNQEMTCEEVGNLELELSNLIENSYNDDAETLKALLDQYKDKFHPQHYLILILKWLLMNIYGRQKGYQYPLLDQELIQNKLNYCQGKLEIDFELLINEFHTLVNESHIYIKI